MTLGVADLGRSVRFYESLGWAKASSSNEQIAWFDVGGTHLGLFPYEELARDANLPTAAPHAFYGFTLAINVPSEQAVTDALAAAEQAGAKIIKPAQRADWGGFSGYFADPDGFAWEVAFNPHFPLDSEGNLTIP